MVKISKYIPIIGQQFRDWTVISDKIFKVESNRDTYWMVRCKCGEEVLRSATHLVNFRTNACKSCVKLNMSFEKSYLNKVKRRSDKMNFEFNLTLEHILSIFDGKCKLSNEDISFGKHWKKLSEQTASLDRIDSTKGYIIGNVQWVHKDVNFMKGLLTQERFLELCNKINSKCS